MVLGSEVPMPRWVFLPLLLSIFGLPLTSITAWPHDGGLDAYGCHKDRKHGAYHCHQGPLAGQSYASQKDMLVALQALQTESGPTSRESFLMGCRLRPHPEGTMRAPFLLIEEGPIPGADSDRPLPPSEVMCVEILRKAGRKAVEANKVTEGILLYLSLADTAPAQAGETYLDLATVLDQASYPQPAVIAYRKAWTAYEAGFNLRGFKIEGAGLLTLATIRDSIVRLGGQVPLATSEPGKIVAANSTSKIMEQYFDKAFPSVTPQ
jgi:hypothetical protein